MAALCHGLALAAQGLAQTCLGLGGLEEVHPLALGLLGLRGQHLHLVARAEAVVEGHQPVVDLARYAVQAQVGVQGKGHVEHRRVSGQGDEFALGGEDDDFAGEEVEFQRVKKVNGAGLGVVEDVFDGAQPD